MLLIDQDSNSCYLHLSCLFFILGVYGGCWWQSYGDKKALTMFDDLSTWGGERYLGFIGVFGYTTGYVVVEAFGYGKHC